MPPPGFGPKIDKKKQEAPTILEKRGSTKVEVKKKIQIKPRLEGNRALTELAVREEHVELSDLRE